MKKYVLYGVGVQGEIFFYKHYTLKDEIAYCIDGFHTGTFHGLPIVKVDEAKNLSMYKILVAAVWENYEKIKTILIERGLVEYINFLWASEYEKKLVVINANCYGAALKRNLEQCECFKKEYIIHPIPQIQQNKSMEIEKSLLQRADVFIHQDIRADNKYGYKLSDEYIRKNIKEECIDITMPNFVGIAKWLFPQQAYSDKYLVIGENRIGIRDKDNVLEEAYENSNVI